MWYKLFFFILSYILHNFFLFFVIFFIRLVSQLKKKKKIIIQLIQLFFIGIIFFYEIWTCCNPSLFNFILIYRNWVELKLYYNSILLFENYKRKDLAFSVRRIIFMWEELSSFYFYLLHFYFSIDVVQLLLNFYDFLKIF